MLPALTLILGGAASGKSAFAEALAEKSGISLVYLASAQAFDADPEVQALTAEVRDEAIEPLLGAYTPERAAGLKDLSIDVDAVAAKGLAYEKLDQLMIEHLLGAR